MADKKFILELNETQLTLVNVALEEYFRIRMSQWFDLADDLTERLFDLSEKSKDRDTQLALFYEKRNDVQIAFESVGRMIWGGTPISKTREQDIAIDIWEVIRHTLWLENHDPDEDSWCVDSRPPMNCSGEPLPKCRGIDE